MSAKRKGPRKAVRASGRGRPFRDPNPIVVIVCEGEETEPNYLNAKRASKRISKEQVRIFGSKEAGTHPKSIVEFAKEKKRDMEREGLPIDRVWCVFDRDSHMKIEEAFVQANDLKFEVAFSNPCFELWYFYTILLPYMG